MANNKDYLSQEEIDALLKQSSDEPEDSASSQPDADVYLSSLEQDALGEIGNITFGSAATALSTLLGKKVDITTPKVSVVSKSELRQEFPQPHVAVHVNYVDGFHGINLLVIKTNDAQVIADLMMGGDGTAKSNELTDIHISAVQEAMNQMMGSSATSMSTIFNRFVNISPPGIDILDLQDEAKDTLPPDEVLIKISFRLTIEDLIDSNIMQLLPIQFAKDMVSILMGGGQMADNSEAVQEIASHMTSEAGTAQTESHSPAYSEQPPVSQQPPAYQQPPYAPPAAVPDPQQPPVYQQPPAAAAYQYPPDRNVNVNVQAAQFANFSAPPPVRSDDTNLNMLLDIPLRVTVELGRTQKLIKDILDLSQGSIIELDKLAGEPVDILVNNKLIAKGEVVVIDENFGVRVTDIINQWDRIQKLQ